MSLKKKLFVSVGEDPPRMYGDEPYVQQLGESEIASAPYARG